MKKEVIIAEFCLLVLFMSVFVFAYLYIDEEGIYVFSDNLYTEEGEYTVRSGDDALINDVSINITDISNFCIAQREQQDVEFSRGYVIFNGTICYYEDEPDNLLPFGPMIYINTRYGITVYLEKGESYSFQLGGVHSIDYALKITINDITLDYDAINELINAGEGSPLPSDYEDESMASVTFLKIDEVITPTEETGPIDTSSGVAITGAVIEENEEEISEKVYGCNGCEVNSICYPFGYIKEKEYCSERKIFISQQEKGSSCNNNFECKNNFCVDNKCVSKGFFQKILDWFKQLFKRG